MSRAQSSPALKANDGDLPEGWQHEQLGELSELVRDQIHPSAAAGLPYVGLEHIDPGEPTLKRWGDPEDVRSAKTRFAPGDILYGKLRPYLDKSVLAPFAGICSTDILVLRAQANRAIPDFLVSAIHTKPFLEHAVNTTAGVNHPRTSWNALKVHALAAPPIPEQRAIAGVLRTVQEAKEACERVLAATRELKQSLLHHLFAYGPVPFAEADQVPHKETEIGEIPSHWDVMPLGEGFSVFSGFAFKSQDFTTEGIPVIKIGNLQGGTVIIDKDTTYFPRHLVSSAHDRFALHTGDVLIAMTGATTGKVSTLPPNLEGALLNQRVGKIALREESQLLLEFVKRFVATTFFQTEVQENILKSAQGNISPKSIEKILVPRPLIPEQREIAAQLEAVDLKLAAEESRRAALAVLFQSLLHHLMTGRVRLPEFVGGRS